MDKKEKTITNIGVGFLCQLLTLALGLIVPKIVLVNYGSDTNGLIGTISQIFTYLALLEAGISQVAKNMMYKPIAEDDQKEISYWMSVARRYYRKISFFYFACVCVLATVIPVLLKTKVPYFTIFFYVLFEGLTNVVAFYFINAWTCFLSAKGQNYVISTVNLVSVVLCYTIKILLTLTGLNITFIQVGYFAVSLLKLCLYKAYIRKRYDWIDYNAAPKTAQLPDRNSYVISEITWTIFSSTDMLVLSVFCSTAMSSVYSVYNMVFIALSGLLGAMYHAVNYHLGQTYHEDYAKYIKLHNAFNSIFMSGITTLMSVCFLLIIPFVKLYTSGVEDIEYVYQSLPLLFCMIQMLTWSRYVGGNLIGVAGRQKPAVKINVIEAVINVALSLILVKCMGIVGVLLATVIALPWKVVYCNYVADKIILKRKPWKTIAILGINYLIFGIVVYAGLLLPISIEGYLELFVYGILLTLLIAFITVVLNCLVNRELVHTIGMVRHK